MLSQSLRTHVAMAAAQEYGKLPDRLTLAEASDYLNIPANTLRWWRTSGEGPRSYSLGRKVFYDRADLDAWVNAQKSATVRGGV